MNRLNPAGGQVAVMSEGTLPDAGSAIAARAPGSLADVEDRREAYLRVMREYGPALRRLAGVYARSAAEREDVAQDVSLAIWRALAGFRGEASIKTFVFRVAHNCAISHLRRRRPVGEDVEVAEDCDGLDRRLERSRQRERLVNAIAELPLGMRQVVTLHLEGLRYAEIGEIVGITEKNVSARLSRARARLKETLAGSSGGAQ